MKEVSLKTDEKKRMQLFILDTKGKKNGFYSETTPLARNVEAILYKKNLGQMLSCIIGPFENMDAIKGFWLAAVNYAYGDSLVKQNSPEKADTSAALKIANIFRAFSS